MERFSFSTKLHYSNYITLNTTDFKTNELKSKVIVDLMADDSHSHRHKWDPNSDDVNSGHVISPLVKSQPLAVTE